MNENRHYGDANDKFVCEVDFYVTAGSSGAAGKIYSNSAKTTLATTAELEHVFKIGALMLIAADGEKSRAVAFSVSSEVATVVGVIDGAVASFNNEATV